MKPSSQNRRLAQNLFLGLFGVGLSLLAGCATTGSKPAPVALFPEYALSDSTAATQTKSNVTISVVSLRPSRMYDFPELFSFRKEDVPAPIAGMASFNSYFQPDYEGRYWDYTLGSGEKNLAAFEVAITNGTDHILRMKDSRIYLEVPDQDPVPATTNLGNPTLVPSTDPAWQVVPKSLADADESLIHAVTHYELEQERDRKKHTLMDNLYTLPVGIGSQVIAQNRDAYKLIADTDREILPGRTFKGILLFPVVVSFDTATLSFFDIHTKTDPAGNPTEKQNFSFPVKLERVQMQWDGKQEKRWKRIAS